MRVRASWQRPERRLPSRRPGMAFPVVVFLCDSTRERRRCLASPGVPGRAVILLLKPSRQRLYPWAHPCSLGSRISPSREEGRGWTRRTFSSQMPSLGELVWEVSHSASESRHGHREGLVNFGPAQALAPGLTAYGRGERARVFVAPQIWCAAMGTLWAETVTFLNPLMVNRHPAPPAWLRFLLRSQENLPEHQGQQLRGDC